MFFGKEFLSLTDNLNQCLQRSSLSATERQEITKHVVTGLSEKRNDECFDMLWNQMMEKKSKHEAAAEPVMLQKRKVPSRYYSNGNDIGILNYFIANIFLMLLTTLLEILKNDLISQIIRFILNCRILS